MSVGSGRSGRSLLLVHAHPDDESITTGVTMARYAAQGVSVTLITCTRGERGEVIPAELAHLSEVQAGDGGDALAEVRTQELAAAMAALGVSDHRFLDELTAPDADADVAGGRGRRGAGGRRYRDSGMAFDADGRIALPDDVVPDAFALADLDETAAPLAALITRLRSDAVVTYDPGGGYGHPDHVQAHRITMRAVELVASGADGFTPRVFWVVRPLSVAQRQLAELAAAADNPFAPASEGPFPSMVVPDGEVHVAIDGSVDGTGGAVVDGGRFVESKVAALRAHRTQVEVAAPYFALSNGIGHPIAAVEYFSQVAGPSLPSPVAGACAGDLFAGLPSA